MKKIILVGLLAGACLAGCRTFPPVYNVEHQTVQVNDLQKVEKAIRVGAAQRGWEVNRVSPGLMRASLVRRSHRVEVNIPYGADFYSILYQQSEHLNYDTKKGTIHPRYNTWIKNLNQSIQVALAEQL